jgi:hypothetical protein
MITCDVCSRDLSGLDVEFHYSRSHNLSADFIPWEVLLLSLRESNARLAELEGFCEAR